MRFAIIVGGSECVDEEVAQAQFLCRGYDLEYFFINDQISHFPDEGYAISLHPEKIPLWLNERRQKGYPTPLKVWCHRQHKNKAMTHVTPDWGGSSGLFALKIAREEEKHDHIILCGVPMKTDAKHFVRRINWTACEAFLRGWRAHTNDLRPYVRSMSGWTRELLGAPDEAFLTE